MVYVVSFAIPLNVDDKEINEHVLHHYFFAHMPTFLFSFIQNKKVKFWFLDTVIDD